VSARAGIVVTGTEVLSGIIADRNGPWLAERLRERGVQLAHVMIVGDRPEDLRAALEFLAREGMDLIITSGGLGPTADDLTAEVVAEFAGREMRLDEALEGRIAAILERLRARWRSMDRPDADPLDQDARPDAQRASTFEDAMRLGNRKQAMVPEGATVLEPVGTAPGLVVPAGGTTVLVLPGPPGELQPMWRAAQETAALAAALAGAGVFEQRIMRLFGPPESEIAKTLRDAESDGVPLDRLEITTCLRRGEIEIATVFEPDAADDYAAFEAAVLERHGATVFARDGETIDDLVAGALLGPPVRTVAVAESCTGGLMAGRLTDRAGSSEYVLGGLTVYSNEAKVELAGVDGALIERHGAVSPEVAAALADGAIERLGSDIGIGITGIAGPGGGSELKPVGTVCRSVAARAGSRIDRTLQLPGNRAMVRERTTTVAMHLLRRLLRDGGE
jgi:nicotinamide-nucleotide amidase